MHQHPGKCNSRCLKVWALLIENCNELSWYTRKVLAERRFKRVGDTIFVPPPCCSFYSIISINVLENRKGDKIKIYDFLWKYGFLFGLLDCLWTICVLLWIKEVTADINLFSYKVLKVCSLTRFLISFIICACGRGFWPCKEEIFFFFKLWSHD